jgi:hypothetical protein
MLEIRADQIEAFTKPRREQLVGKVVRYLREKCPKQTAGMSNDELAARAKGGFERAGKHGFAVEWDLCRYCWLEMLHGPAFADEMDWAHTIVASEGVPATERMDMLEKYQRNYYEPRFTPTPRK